MYSNESSIKLRSYRLIYIPTLSNTRCLYSLVYKDQPFSVFQMFSSSYKREEILRYAELSLMSLRSSKDRSSNKSNPACCYSWCYWELWWVERLFATSTSRCMRYLSIKKNTCSEDYVWESISMRNARLSFRSSFPSFPTSSSYYSMC